MSEQTLAQNAYQAYGQTTDFKNFQGNPMPEWEALPETIQRAWGAAVSATLKAVAPTPNPDLVSIGGDELQVLLGDTGLAIHQAIQAEVTRQLAAFVADMTDGAT